MKVYRASQLQGSPSILVFGGSGSGKSAICALADGGEHPPLIIATEMQALPTIRGLNPDAMVIPCLTMPELREAIEAVADRSIPGMKDGTIRTVCLDGITETQQMIKDEILLKKLGMSESEIIEAGGTVATIEAVLTQQDWGWIIGGAKNILRAIRNTKMRILVTGLEQVNVTNSFNNQGQAVETHWRRVSVQGKKLPGELMALFSAVGYAQKRTVPVLNKDGTNGDTMETLHLTDFSTPSYIETKSCINLKGLLPSNGAEFFRLLG